MTTKQKLEKAIASLVSQSEGIAAKMHELEEKQSRIDDQIETLEKELEKARFNFEEYSETLKELKPIVEVHGTGHERELVHSVLDGETPDDHGLFRLRTLVMQFLQRVM